MSVCGLPGICQNLLDAVLFGLSRCKLLCSMYLPVLRDQLPTVEQGSQGHNTRCFDQLVQCPFLRCKTIDLSHGHEAFRRVRKGALQIGSQVCMHVSEVTVTRPPDMSEVLRGSVHIVLPSGSTLCAFRPTPVTMCKTNRTQCSSCPGFPGHGYGAYQRTMTLRRGAQQGTAWDGGALSGLVIYLLQSRTNEVDARSRTFAAMKSGRQARKHGVDSTQSMLLEDGTQQVLVRVLKANS